LFEVLLDSHWLGKVQWKFSELYLQSLIHYKVVKLKNIKKHPIKFVLRFSSELTIKYKALKIFTALFLTNVNPTKPQTTKSALRFRRSISLNENENDFLWGCSHRHFSGFKLLYHLGVISVNKFLKIKNLVYMLTPDLASVFF